MMRTGSGAFRAERDGLTPGVALTIEAIGEALLFAAKAAANPANVRKALMGGFASSPYAPFFLRRVWRA